MNDPIEQRLREIEERATAATEGPWQQRDTNVGRIIGGRDREYNSAIACTYAPIANPNPAAADAVSLANAIFIAAARTDIPWLLARLREAHREIRRLQANRARRQRGPEQRRRELPAMSGDPKLAGVP